MIGRTSRRLLVAVIGVAVALTATTGAAAAAVPPGAAEASPLGVTATDMTYGQPDLTGFRTASTAVTITNNTQDVIEYPTLTFPHNGRDEALHAGWAGCPFLRGQPDAVICVAEPLAAGETRSLEFLFGTEQAGPAGPATFRAEVGTGIDGASPVPGTAVTVTFQVSFAPLTGTFGITATDLRYGPTDAQGVQHGSTAVTLTNLTGEPIRYPVLTFPFDMGTPATNRWRACEAIHQQPTEANPVCVTRPLAAGQSRTMRLAFSTDQPTFEFTALVRVDAGTGTAADAPVIPGTAAGTSFEVISPDFG
jgi:hypothetical protein